MGLPMFDCAVRTSQVTAATALCGILPAASAPGTGRPLRLRQILISNTTTTAFQVAWGMATAAGATPGGAGTVARRGFSGIDPPSTVQGVYTTWATNPTAPAGYSFRGTVPGGSLLAIPYNDDEELLIPPAATALPFCIWNISTGQISDVTFTWEE